MEPEPNPMRDRYRLAYADAAETSPPRAAILPVPYDRTACYQAGARNGPDAILHASRQLEFFDEELGFDPSAGVATLAPLDMRADGPRAMLDDVRAEVGDLLAAGVFPVILGGEHSITIGAVEAVREHVPGAGVLHLDAHADLRDEYEGSRWSHACVMRRVREGGPAVSVGIRSYSAEEHVYIRAEGLTLHSARSFPDAARNPGGLLADLPETVYITLDADVLDPSIMPATGTPEPGGLSYRDVNAILDWVSAERRVVGLDIVEHLPIPGLVAPTYLLARLLHRTLGRVLGPSI
jgi:agmatinase